MIFAFAMTFYSNNFFATNEKVVNKSKSYQLLSAIGFYDGIFGPGSSALTIYVFSNDQLQYYKATRISLLGWCSGALISYISSGHMIWSMAFAITGGAIIDGFLGVFISKKINMRYVKPLLRLMMLMILIQLIKMLG